MMRRTLPTLLLVVLMAAALPAPAAVDSGYPIQDPLVATVAGTPTELRAELSEDVPITTRAMRQIVDRPVPGPLAYALPLEFGLAAQDGPAPLAFVVTGTGGTARSAKTDVLIRALYAEGYHVVSLPSPTSVGFILGASTHPMPGRMPADVADLHRMMEAIDERLSDSLDVTGYALAGYSLGGLQAAFLANHDAEAGRFGFSRVLLINPAVDLYQAVERMDCLLECNLGADMNAVPRFLERTLGQLKRVYAGGEPLEFNQDFIYRAFRATDTDRQDVAAMVGLAFRLWLANMSFAADLLTDAGVIVPRGRDDVDTSRMEHYLVRSFSISFTEYLDELLLPYYNRDGRSVSRERLIEEGRMAHIGDYLADAEHIGVITNADELILDDDDLGFLRNTFGERATIFENGGHMGNFEHRRTIETIRTFFRQ